MTQQSQLTFNSVFFDSAYTLSHLESPHNFRDHKPQSFDYLFNIHSNFDTTTGPSVINFSDTYLNDYAEESAWRHSESPRWNEYKTKLTKYESLYNRTSDSVMKNGPYGQAGDSIPHEQVADWIRTYTVYWT